MTVQEEGQPPSVGAPFNSKAPHLLSGRNILGVNWPQAKRGQSPFGATTKSAQYLAQISVTGLP